jgi:PAS domain S-box-containing protein
VFVVQAFLISVLLANLVKRRRAERSLVESEKRFRTAADAAPMMIWISGLDKLCTFFNKPWLEFTGRTLEREMGNGWTDGVHPDDLPGCFKTYIEAFEARQPFVMEYRLRRHDGSIAGFPIPAPRRTIGEWPVISARVWTLLNRGARLRPWLSENRLRQLRHRAEGIITINEWGIVESVTGD